jgi:hypothetical protein
MKLSNPLGYIIRGEFDVSKIAEEVKLVDSYFWDLDESRQKYRIHRETKSLFMYTLPLTWDGIEYPLKTHSISEKLDLYTKEIKDHLENLIPGGKVGRTLYVNLPAKKRIPKHRDNGYYLTNVHRIHLPIITNNNVRFLLGDNSINMKAGTFYEIDNAGFHAVNNDSDQDRIHLIMDIIPPNAFK